MASMEGNAPITLGEYMSHEKTRVDGLKLQADSMYTAMFRLDSKTLPAVKVAIHLIEVVRDEGPMVITFAPLDSDLHDGEPVEAFFRNGYVNNFSDKIVIPGIPSGSSVGLGVMALQGYFRDYFSDIYDYLGDQRMVVSQSSRDPSRV